MKDFAHFKDWYLAIEDVMDVHGIKDAEELSFRLYGQPKPTVTVTIPPSIMHNYAQIPSKPTIGRIVHYITGAGKEWPAMIIEVIHVDNPSVYLQIFSNYGVAAPHTTLSEYCDVAFHQKLTWHWPERKLEGANRDEH